MSSRSMQMCPKCKKGVLSSRIKRSWAIKILLFWLPLKRYRCNYCSEKVYMFNSPKRSKKRKLQVSHSTS